MNMSENEPPLVSGVEEINRLTGQELVLANSEYQKAKKLFEEKGIPNTLLRPNSPAYFKLQRELRDKELKQAEAESIRKAEIAKNKEPVLIEREKLVPIETKLVGTIDIRKTESELRLEKLKSVARAIKKIFENPATLKILEEKLPDIKLHRPDPNKFKDLPDAEEGFYSEEEIEKNLQYVIDIQSEINQDKSQFGESLKNRREAGFDQSEWFQKIIIDLINNGLIPEMEAIMTHEYDDLHAGIDSVMQFKKEHYFGASFDMTMNEDREAIEKKLQKNWDHYISQGRVPYVKYFEDPENPEERGRRVMPKFVIGGSPEDFLHFVEAYVSGNQQSLIDHPIKYTVIAQIDAQLEKIINFYNSPENILNSDFDYARTQYKNFEVFLIDIKKSVQYDKMIVENDEVKEHIKNNKVLQFSKSYIPKIEPIKPKEAA